MKEQGNFSIEQEASPELTKDDILEYIEKIGLKCSIKETEEDLIEINIIYPDIHHEQKEELTSRRVVFDGDEHHTDFEKYKIRPLMKFINSSKNYRCDIYKVKLACVITVTKKVEDEQ